VQSGLLDLATALAKSSIATWLQCQYVAFYNLYRTHEALWMTPAMALGSRTALSVADLIEATLRAVPTKPALTPAQRRRQYRSVS
jgi:hypothetical protein